MEANDDMRIFEHRILYLSKTIMEMSSHSDYFNCLQFCITGLFLVTFVWTQSLKRIIWTTGDSIFTDWMHCYHTTNKVQVSTNQRTSILQPLYRSTLPSVLWCCGLGGRKGIRPVKNWVVGCWRGYLSGTRCRLAYGPADATATHCLLFQ